MLDPVIKSALFGLIVSVLTALVAKYVPGFPITPELINSIAVVILSFLLSLVGYEGLKLSNKRLTAKLQERGLLPKE